MLRRTKREHALFGAGLIFIPTRAAESGIESIFVQRLLKSLRLHDIGMHCRTMAKRPDIVGETIRVNVYQEIQPEFFCSRISKFDHFLEFPRRVDV